MNSNEQAKTSIKKATDMSFGSAFDMICIHDNYYMRLPKWSPDVKIRVQKPDQNSDQRRPLRAGADRCSVRITGLNDGRRILVHLMIGNYMKKYSNHLRRMM